MPYIFQCQLAPYVSFKENITHPYNLGVTRVSHLDYAKVSNSIIRKQLQVRSSMVGGCDIYNPLNSLLIYMQTLI